MVIIQEHYLHDALMNFYDIPHGWKITKFNQML